MSSSRYVVLGLATVRAAWPRDVTGWSMAGALPIEFVKCVSVEEVKARLRSGRRHSAVLVDGGAVGVDRDLLALVHDHDTVAIVVGSDSRNWTELGADAQLHEVFSRQDLHDRLIDHATPVGRVVESANDLVEAPTSTSFRGRLVAVTGRAGSGTSTLAIAAAQAFGRRPATTGQVVLMDGALDANLAMLHDASDVVPGIQELTDGHRSARMTTTQIRQMMHEVTHRRYDLLLGLRRQHDWVAIRPRAFSSALDGLMSTYRMIIADITADFEGESLTGSIDVEERNVVARTTALAADLVLAVGTPGLVGVHGLVATIDSLLSHGVEAERILPVVNFAPRSNRVRADMARAVIDLVNSEGRESLASPMYLPKRKHLDDAHRNGTDLPNALTAPIANGIEGLLTRVGDRPKRVLDGDQPQPIAAGSLGMAAQSGEAAS